MAEITIASGTRGVQLVLDASAVVQGKVSVRLLSDAGQIITVQSSIEPQIVGGKRVLIATFSTKYFPRANYFIETAGEGPNAVHLRYALKVLGR